MNKTAIKNFAIGARRRLIRDIANQMQLLGITEKETKEKLPQSTLDTEFYDIGTRTPYEVTGEAVRQRQALVQRIRQKADDEDYTTAYNSVVEEVAYTWFNRLIAIRFMEVNDYLPGRTRVLSSESPNKVEPDLVTDPYNDRELEFTATEREQISAFREKNDMDGLFKLLFIKECNALNAYLPELFERTRDYSELLLNLSITDPDGVVRHLVQDIPEADFDVEQGGQVEIIGWMYQFYNAEPKASAFAGVKQNKKITKGTIPAATQLFTPDWIVRYMVENSLGRLWIQGHMDVTRKESDVDVEHPVNHTTEKEMAEYFHWKYYLPEAKQDADVEEQLAGIRREYANKKLEDIKFLDPCMGSGHILVYAFDVFMQLYIDQGYDEKDAVEAILENNLYGLDIDDRAFQLAYFALYMKACEYGGRRVLKKHIELNICAIQESNGMEEWKEKGQIKLGEDYIREANTLIEQFIDAKEYGSLLTCAKGDYKAFLDTLNEIQLQGNENILLAGWIRDIVEKMPILVKQAIILSAQYDVVTTNPPYLGAGMGERLSDYLKKYYPNGKIDLFAAFIERCSAFTQDYGYQAMITQQSWMFLTSYEKMRNELQNKCIINMIHLGTRAFDDIPGEVVQTTAFVLTSIRQIDYVGTYIRLVEETSSEGKRQILLNRECTYYSRQKNYMHIPGGPIAYWANKNCGAIFSDNDKLGAVVNCKSGIMAGDESFIKLWYEVKKNKIKFDCKSSDDMGDNTWFPLNSGGDYRNWYGNNIKIINLWHDGYYIRNNVKNYRLRDKKYYFRSGITWGRITSSKIAFRNVIKGSLFGDAGPVAFVNENRFYILGFLCSCVSTYFLKILNPTVNSQVHDLLNLPLIVSTENAEKVTADVSRNLQISKQDWDSFETSWDFQCHPLMVTEDSHNRSYGTLQVYYVQLKADFNDRFTMLKENEEALNRIFIDIYGLEDELTPVVDNKNVTVSCVFDTKEEIPDSMKGSNYVLTRSDVVKSLISYAVGCMLGRYSLDTPGLAYAGGEMDPSKYTSYKPDADNVIPITDEDYFNDDIVGYFVSWMKAAFGPENLEKNLTFVADALGTKGIGSRDKIRTYFLKDFYKDHVKTYKKRPIYWLYDSGKKNGFKALVYMHRYDADTTGRVRMDYLHRMERTYEAEIERMTQEMESGGSAHDIAKARKRRDKLQLQLKECQAYDEQIAQPALARIDIDLDDGVKVNYEKVQTVDGKTYKMLAKVF